MIARIDQAKPVASLLDEFGLAQFLRSHGYSIGVYEELRLVALLRWIATSYITLDSPTAVARWIAPIVCLSQDQQFRLPELVAAWLRLQAKQPLVQTELPVVDPPIVAALTAKRAERFVLPALVFQLILGGIAAIFFLFLWLLGPDSVSPPPRPDIIDADGPITLWSVWVPKAVVALNNAIPLITIPLVALTIYLAWRRRELALLRGMVLADEPHKSLQLSLVALPLFVPSAVRTSLHDLRRHELLRTQGIDINASIVATIASAGYIQLVSRRQPVTPEHLLFVDRAAHDDHMAFLADILVGRLRSEHVEISRYDFKGDPRRLQAISDSGNFGAVVNLDAIQAASSSSRLLLLSDGSSFFDNTTGYARPWTEQLRQWKTVAILTPLAAAYWGPRERKLAELGFLLFEATPAGLKELAREIRLAPRSERPASGAPMASILDRHLALDPYLWVGDASPDPAQIRGLINDLRFTLGSDGFLYLCALAVFPELNPRLTVLVGSALVAADQTAMLSEEKLCALSRLPWFRTSRMPDWLRLALVRDLTTRPSEARYVRAVWTALLEPREAAPDTMLSVVPRFDSAMLAVVNDLLHRGETPAKREAILVAFMRRAPLPELAVGLPAALDRLMRPRGTASDIIAASGTLAMLIAAFALPDTVFQSMQGIATRLLKPHTEIVSLVLSVAALASWLGQALRPKWAKGLVTVSRTLAIISVSLACAVSLAIPGSGKVATALGVLAIVCAWMVHEHGPKAAEAIVKFLARVSELTRSITSNLVAFVPRNFRWPFLNAKRVRERRPSRRIERTVLRNISRFIVGQRKQFALLRNDQTRKIRKAYGVVMTQSRTVALVVLSSVLWVVGMLIVAFPERVLALNIASIFSEFVASPLRPASIMIVLLIDIAISVSVLDNSGMRKALSAGNRLAFMFSFVMLYFLVAVFLPLYIVTTESLDRSLGAASLAILVALRSLSYLSPQRAVSVRRRRPAKPRNNSDAVS